METSLLVAALLPCVPLPPLVADPPQLPLTLLVQARRLRLNISLDLLYYELAYKSAVKRQALPEIAMRAYHIRTAKSQIQALHNFLDPLLHQPPKPDENPERVRGPV